MECINLEYRRRRPLPPELHSEWHKCLPLPDAINVLVNVPSRAIYQNNSPRIRRNIQRIKTVCIQIFLNNFTIKIDLPKLKNRLKLGIDFLLKFSIIFQSLKEYIDSLVNGEGNRNNQEGMNAKREIEWKPQLDALLRYGTWMTQMKRMHIPGTITGIPKNFIGDLLLNLANSR